MKKEHVEEFFRRLAETNPEPKSELHYRDPYTLLVAVVLSAQATDASVNRATQGLFAAANTPAKMAALGEDRVRTFIQSIGLFKTKAKNVVALSKLLVDRHNSTVPSNREELVSLPGVGRKTANVVLNVAFGYPTIAVDTHVFRVSNRTGLARGKTVEEVEKKLLRVVPAKWKQHAHHWLILHGRYSCTARKPKCQDCVLRNLCHYMDKNN